MKLTIACILAALAMLLVGCGQGEATTKEDDAFQKGLAEMAAKNPNSAASSKTHKGQFNAPPKGAGPGAGVPPPAGG